MIIVFFVTNQSFLRVFVPLWFKPFRAKSPLACLPFPAMFPAMSTVQEIENAIDRLDDEQVAELRAWLFDRDIARDAASGKLDSLADEALRESRAGRTKPL